MRRFLGGVLLFVFLGVYFVGLIVWSPLFLLWPSRYERMSYAETVATRWVLVRHTWAIATLPMHAPTVRHDSRRRGE